MHEIATTITVGDRTEVEVAKYDFDTQEEVFSFLNDFASYEMDVLYAALRLKGDRTTCLIERHDRRSMRRVVTGTTRRDGAKPIEGSVAIEVRRVA